MKNGNSLSEPVEGFEPPWIISLLITSQVQSTNYATTANKKPKYQRDNWVLKKFCYLNRFLFESLFSPEELPEYIIC
jgi:hypothetical protein